MGNRKAPTPPPPDARKPIPPPPPPAGKEPSRFVPFDWPAAFEAQLSRLIGILGVRPLPIGREKDLHDEIEARCHLAGIAAKREYQLGRAFGRLDLFIPSGDAGDPGVAIELKADGGPSTVLRQLLRYADSPEVGALLLVTSRAALRGGLPATLNDKPLRVYCAWRDGL